MVIFFYRQSWTHFKAFSTALYFVVGPITIANASTNNNPPLKMSEPLWSVLTLQQSHLLQPAWKQTRYWLDDLFLPNITIQNDVSYSIIFPFCKQSFWHFKQLIAIAKSNWSCIISKLEYLLQQVSLTGQDLCLWSSLGIHLLLPSVKLCHAYWCKIPSSFLHLFK